MPPTETDDDLDLDDIDEGEGGTPEGATPPELTPEQKMTALEAQVSELKKGTASDQKMEQLLEMGKQFLAAQAAPKPAVVDTEGNKEKISAFGKMLQDTVISGTPEDLANLFMASVNEATGAKVNQALRDFGAPLAEKAGSFTVQAFLSHKKDELGEAGEKTHRLVARDFKLTDDERAWIATARADAVSRFLTNKYEAAAGQILLRSASKARPKNIGGGSGGGGGSNVVQFPGVAADRQRELEKLAEGWWPDKAVREQKMKAVAQQLAEGA